MKTTKTLFHHLTSAWMLLFCSNAADAQMFSGRKSIPDNPERRPSPPQLCAHYDVHADICQSCMCCTQSFSLHVSQLRGQRDGANISSFTQLKL